MSVDIIISQNVLFSEEEEKREWIGTMHLIIALFPSAIGEFHCF